MSEHEATISWSRDGHEFSFDTYSRDHVWSFAGGTRLAASAAPDFKGNPKLVDPESGLVAAAASCHMLTFLAIAARKRLVVERYEDAAVGVLEKNDAGKLAVTRITLRPKVAFGGTPPDAAALAKLHEQAHEHCFIANSVRTEIAVEPVA